MIAWHRHHLKPKHAGGGDDACNIVRVNVAMHAVLHKCLFEEYGNIGDYLAWKGLTGCISRAEIIKEISRENGRKNKGKKNRLGKTHSQETKNKISATKIRNKVVLTAEQKELRREQTLKRYNYLWVINSPEGIEYKIKNLTKFCSDYGLSQSRMNLLANKKIDKYKGWSCDRHPQKLKENELCRSA